MAEERFKERVRLEIMKEAKRYKEIYVDYEYLICSSAFENRTYYIVDAKKDNYQHLTGVHSQISAQSFFDKCLDGSLSEEDFDFIKKGQNEKSVKGTVRRKIKALPDMMELFREGLQAEEDFKKNKVICSFATADGNCTLGFTDSEKARPKSLIRGNELKNPKPVELVLRRKSGAELFDEIIVGDKAIIHKYQDKIGKFVCGELLNQKITIIFEIKANPTGWSDQEIHFSMKTGTVVDIVIRRTCCELQILGKDNLDEIIFAIWEILAWNDGYFYKPVEYWIDGVEYDINELLRTPYYVTDSKWKSSALLIGRNHREISEEIITRYMQIRNAGREQKSLNRTMFSSYFYLHSENYKALNIEHRLVLLMHICDGFAIAFLQGNHRDNSGNINKVLECVDIGPRLTKKYRTGAQMLGVPHDKAKEALQDTRTELTHYVYKKSSFGSFISDPNFDTDNMINWYVFYVLDVALRVSLLEIIGATITDDVKSYLLDENLDWIRLEKHLNEECVISRNALKQILQKLQGMAKDKN
ncbi:MAG: PBECR4 domain-containing protein [Eubacteriales bacterium]|nr:PBECR4 domain-containing protein [Eubacteriales bacterium]